MKKNFAIFLSLFIISISAHATIYTCQALARPNIKNTVMLSRNIAGDAFLALDQKTYPVLKTVQLKFSSNQIDKCELDNEFENCIRAVLGKIDAYQMELPTTLAFLRFHERAGTFNLQFDTSVVARGEMFFTVDFNPGTGYTAFVRFFDKQDRPLGQIMEWGLGILSECIE